MLAIFDTWKFISLLVQSGNVSSWENSSQIIKNGECNDGDITGWAEDDATEQWLLELLKATAGVWNPNCVQIQPFPL